jgi:predicted nucleic acid-binding protein
LALILDTGPLYALFDSHDAHNAACRDLIATSAEPLLVPSPVLVEVDYLLVSRGYGRFFLNLLNDIHSGQLHVQNLVLEDYVRIRELCERYADADIGFVDAAVLAIVERLNEPKLATLDRRHFSLLRPRHVDSLQLLP